jgi:transcriptional regulator with XRE-family HTH domain
MCFIYREVEMAKLAGMKVKMFEAGVTQADLSKATRIPRSTISLGLNGRYIFSEAQKARIAKALKCAPAELFGDK